MARIVSTRHGESSSRLFRLVQRPATLRSQPATLVYGANNVSNNVFVTGRSIFVCPTAANIPYLPGAPNPLTSIEPGAGPGPAFNYGMNQRIDYTISPLP